jgi:hypothetical protein
MTCARLVVFHFLCFSPNKVAIGQVKWRKYIIVAAWIRIFFVRGPCTAKTERRSVTNIVKPN